MADYRKMYTLMCSAASSALDLLPETAENEQARALLQNALYKAEDMYVGDVSSDDEAVV